MEKGQGKGTDTLQTDNVFTRKEYIDREAAIRHIKENQCSKCSDIGLCGNCAVLTSMKLFEAIPAVDVVEVVRCGECKYSDNYGLDLMCKKHSGITKSKLGEDIHFVEWHSKYFLCSDGERKDGDEDGTIN